MAFEVVSGIFVVVVVVLDMRTGMSFDFCQNHTMDFSTNCALSITNRPPRAIPVTSTVLV